MAFDPTTISYSQKLELTLNNAPISANQSDFPLAVVLDGSANSLHVAIFTVE